MRKKYLFAAIILVALCVVLILLGLRQSGALTTGSTTEGGSVSTQTEVQAPITATLSVCGDIMSHSPQTNDAYDAATDTYNYRPCFQYVKPWIENADYAVANFETTLNGPPYSGYPQFSAPDALAADIKDTGFDLVTTANNHSMDKGYDGLVRTLDTMDAAGLAHIGSYRTQEEWNANHGVVVADVGGISVAFLGYTYGTNGIAIPEDRDFCLNRFNTDYTGNCETLDQEGLSQALAYGADLILGSHSHVPQPMETRTVTLEDGSTRSAFVAYSLGNFVSNQSPATVQVNYTDTTAILNLELTKNFETGETTVTNVSYVPLLVLNRGTGVADQYVILDVNDAMADYNAGDTSLVTADVYSKLEYALEGCHTILGEQYDTAGTPPTQEAA